MTPFCCGGEDFGAMHGEQRLVGGHHMLAVGDGLHDHFGHAVAADQLDDDVDFGSVTSEKASSVTRAAPPVTAWPVPGSCRPPP
jgi:hypothetical protein